MQQDPPTTHRLGLRALAAEALLLRGYIGIVLAAIAVSYSGYRMLDMPAAIRIGREDQLFENLTVIFFLTASVLFLLAFRKSRNRFFLVLSAMLFVGAGEEIAWGQRIFGFATPPAIEAVNVQGEVTLHNLKWVHSTDMDGVYKTGVEKVLTVNFLYKLFWLSFGVLIPLAARVSPLVASVLQKWRFPVASLPIGLLFAVNWLTYRAVFSTLPADAPDAYQASAGEIGECLSALVFMMLALWFLRQQAHAPKRAPAPAATALGRTLAE